MCHSLPWTACLNAAPSPQETIQWCPLWWQSPGSPSSASASCPHLIIAQILCPLWILGRQPRYLRLTSQALTDQSRYKEPDTSTENAVAYRVFHSIPAACRGLGVQSSTIFLQQQGVQAAVKDCISLILTGRPCTGKILEQATAWHALSACQQGDL